MVGCRLRHAVLAIFVCALLGAVAFLNIHALGWVFSLVEFFQTRSLAACFIYIAIYIAVCLLSLPLTPLEIFTGYCFGVVFGICLDMIGRITGAVASFLIARLILRHGGKCGCLSKVRNHAILKGVGAAVQERGLRFLILFNLAYLPVAVKNYGLGFVPEVRLLPFVTAIFIIEIPMATMWAWIGSEAAAEVESLSLNATMNATSVAEVIKTRMHQENIYLKFGMIAVGLSAFMFVLHTLHKFVSKELAIVSTKHDEHLEVDNLDTDDV